jgi:transposase
MLGMAGMRVLDAQDVDGELEITVETVDGDGWCRACGVKARSKGRRDSLVRDVAAFDRPVRLRWRKRRWRCPEPACPARTWTEAHEAVASRAVLTDRAQRAACRRVGKDGASVAQVAREYGVGWATVMRAVERHGRPLVDDPARLAGVTHLGVDETAWLSATRTHHTLFVSGLVDTLTGQLLDVVEDRTITAVTRWLARRDPGWLARIGVVALDPYRGYATAMGVHLGHATLVVDHWHVIRLANQCVDQVRRRVQQDTLGHRGRKGDPLYRVRKLAVMAAERLDARGWHRLGAGLAEGDPDGQVAAAWQLKELVRGLFHADGADQAQQVFDVIDAWTSTIDAPECRRLVRTLHRWRDEILAFHTTGGITNARTEACNLGIKQIKRVGRGFRNFRNYRLRLLLACGGVNWQDHPAARLRGRGPQLAA